MAAGRGEAGKWARPGWNSVPALLSSALGHAALNNATPEWKTSPGVSAADKHRRLGGWHRLLRELKFPASARARHRGLNLIRRRMQRMEKPKRHFFGFSFSFLFRGLSWLLETGGVMTGLEGERMDRRWTDTWAGVLCGPGQGAVPL